MDTYRPCIVDEGHARIIMHCVKNRRHRDLKEDGGGQVQASLWQIC